jgi:hypothetical protein
MLLQKSLHRNFNKIRGGREGGREEGGREGVWGVYLIEHVASESICRQGKGIAYKCTSMYINISIFQQPFDMGYTGLVYCHRLD